jgi:hypothetical protein
VVVACVGVAGGFAVWAGRARRGWRLALAVGAAAIVVPLIGKVAGADYLYPRNMIGAWVVLAVVLGAAACVRLGAVAVGAVCLAFLAVTIAVFTDDKLQRADWREAASVIGEPRGAGTVGPPGHEMPNARALVVPAIGDDPIAYYTHGKKLSRGQVPVYEIDVLGFADAPRAQRNVPAGYRRQSGERFGRFELVRYRAYDAPLALTRVELAGARLGIGHAAVVIQTP